MTVFLTHMRISLYFFPNTAVLFASHTKVSKRSWSVVLQSLVASKKYTPHQTLGWAQVLYNRLLCSHLLNTQPLAFRTVCWLFYSSDPVKLLQITLKQSNWSTRKKGQQNKFMTPVNVAKNIVWTLQAVRAQTSCRGWNLAPSSKWQSLLCQIFFLQLLMCIQHY